MKEENITQLQQIAKMFKTDLLLTPEQVQEILAGIFKLLSNYKKETQTLNEEIQKGVDEVLAAMIDKHEAWCSEMQDADEKMMQEYQQKIDECKYLIEEFKKIKPKDGEPGTNGISPDKQEIIDEIMTSLKLPEYKDQVEMTGETIVDKINELDYTKDNLIDPRRIAGWENWGKSNNKGGMTFGGPTVISNAVDAAFSSLTDGDSIVWDATNKRWKNYAVSGGGGSMSIGGSVTSGTAKSVLYIGASGVLAQDTTNFVYDYTNVRLGVGTNAPNYTTHFKGSTSGGFSMFERTTTGTTGTFGTAKFMATSANDMADTFGVSTNFYIQDNAGTENLIGLFNFLRQGADNSGKFFLTLYNAGVANNTALVIDKDGLVGMGIASPLSRLNIAGSTAINNTLANRGFAFSIDTITVNDAVSSGTITLFSTATVFSSTVTATSATTYSNAQTLYISGAPTASTNVTFTNTWALRVGAGFSGFGGTISPTASGGSDLGFTTIPWGNLYMASEKKIDFANGDVTITHATDTLAFAGAATGYTFDALTTITSTASIQFTIAYDVSNKATFQVSSAGDLTINASGADVQIAAASTFRMLGGFATASTNANANLYVPSAAAGGASSQTEILIGGAAATDFRVYERGSTSVTLSANRSYAGHIIGTMAIIEASSGTHPIIATLAIKPVAITNGTATATNGATLYIEGPATGTTPTNNYSLWVALGGARFDGDIELGNATDTTLSRVSAGIIAIEGINIVTVSSTDTLSNKTLTAPKFADLGYIADPNGNEYLIFDSVASAVNEFTIGNNTTGNAPFISASGGDSNIDINFIPKGTGIVKGTYERFSVRLIDSATAITTGTSKGGDFRISSKAITIKKVGAYVDTAPTGASLLTIDINEAGTTIMATNKITLDASEKTSETAATAPGITDTAIAADAVITFDVDQVGSTVAGSGLVVWIEYVYA